MIWGVGATGGPLVLAAFMGAGGGWRAGYLAIGAALDEDAQVGEFRYR